MDKNERMDFTKADCRSTELYQKAHLEAEGLLDFLRQAPTAWQATALSAQKLKAAGYRESKLSELGELNPGDKGFLTQNGSALLAWKIGRKPLTGGLKIFGAHSDSPALKVKPRAISESEGISRLAVEVYGGPLLNTFFDRPLSLAGRVVLRGKSPLDVEEQLVDFKKPLLILPNLCIHMNRDANNGVKIEYNKVLLPFLAPVGGEARPDLLETLLAEELGVSADDILGFDLLTYDVQAPCFCGLNDCFISSGRLDNLGMLYAGLSGLLASDDDSEGISILLVSDNEEVGSRSKQGAQSLFPRDFMEALVLGLGGSRRDFLGLFEKSFMISADQAHAVHPNYSEYADPTHRPAINGGPVIKLAASQSYASDAHSLAIFRQLAEAADVPTQVFVNRSDLRGGSTIGPISSALIPVSTVDVGNPIWGMHSLRETGGLLDPWYMREIARVFFSL